jgi:hypothetical protein
MFIRLFVDKNDPKSEILINVDNIQFIGAIQANGASQKCVLWFTQDYSVTVDHEFDSVALLLEKATGSRINLISLPPARRPTQPEVISALLHSKSRDSGRID